METHDILDANFDQDESRIAIDLISINKFIVLYLLTFGLYGVWWMYKMWVFFRDKDSLDIIPVARAIFGLFFVYSLFQKIKTYAKHNTYQINYSSEGLFGGYLFLTLISRLDDPYWMISFLAFLCFIQPIYAFNYAIDHSDIYENKIKSGFNGRQIALILAGVLLWLLVIFAMLLPDDF